MKNTNLDNGNDLYLNKILANQALILFRFTVNEKEELRFDYLNGNTELFFGYQHVDFQNHPQKVFSELIYPSDKSKYLISFSEKIRELGKWEFDFRILYPNEGVRWCRINANVERCSKGETIFHGIVTNVSRQKKSEDELRVSELRSQFANLASNIGVWDWNMETNEVFYSNQSLKILEIDDGGIDLISNPEKWDELVHPDDREIYFANIQEHFDGKVPYYETYHRVLCKGRYKWILDRGKVIQRDGFGKPLRIIGTHTDVSVQKEKEQKLQDTYDMVNNQKSKLLNFAHIVSHNLKNHTSNFSTLLTFHKNGYLSTDEVIASFKTVSDELSGTIENLVDLVNVQVSPSIEKQSLNVSQYITKVLSVLNDEIVRQKVEVKNKVNRNIEVSFLPAYLESIILNLTTNSLRYADPEKKETIIEFYIEKFDESDPYFVLCVKDNGLGIDLDKWKDMLFGLYKTFHKHKDSTGIGLYITKNQIESMGGKIEVESQVGVGSIFKIYFKR